MRRLPLLLLALACAFQAFALRVGIVLPFKDASPVGHRAIEFYRGFLLAVDSVKRQGVGVEVFAVDAGATPASLATSLDGGELQGVDIIFGPALASQVDALAEYCRLYGIRLVVPFDIPCPQLGDNPCVYQVSPPADVFYPNAVRLLAGSVDSPNFVLLRCNDMVRGNDGLFSALSQWADTDGLPHSVLNVNADEGTVQKAFDAGRNNVVLPDSPSETALESALVLLRQYPQYRFSLLGYPSWLGLADRHQNDFFAFDAYIVSPYYYHRFSDDIISFDTAYGKGFNTHIGRDMPSAALLGFDVGYYFLAGGNPSPYQQGIRFRQVSESGGQVNDFVQLVHFGTGETIYLIR